MLTVFVFKDRTSRRVISLIVITAANKSVAFRPFKIGVPLTISKKNLVSARLRNANRPSELTIYYINYLLRVIFLRDSG